MAETIWHPLTKPLRPGEQPPEKPTGFCHEWRQSEPTLGDVPGFREANVARLQRDIQQWWAPDNPARLKIEHGIEKWRAATDAEILTQWLRVFHENKAVDDRHRATNWEHWTAAHPRYRGCRLGNFTITCDKQQQVIDRLTAFVARLPERLNDGVNVVLCGPSGSGKDHLLAGLLWEVNQRIAPLPNVNWLPGHDVRCCRYEHVHHVWHSQDSLTDCDKQRILAISDPVLNGQPLTHAAAERMHFLLDAQYREGKTTWATINVKNREELDAHIGAPAADRLLDNAMVIFCDWPSHRRKGDF